MVNFEQGTDIPFTQKYRISEGIYYNLTSLALFEIWLWTTLSDIKKFDRTGAVGYTQMRKISDYSYEPILTGQMNELMKTGEIKMRIVWGETNANYPDGIYDDRETICTGAYLIAKP